jgi:predicted nuclease of restriction endonuclease-like (RecB) superfamily
MNRLNSDDYRNLLLEVKQRIRSAQYAALRAVNKELITLYWDIGQLIVKRQQGETWGKSVVETLSQDLKAEFSGISGFSAANLWRMKLFYETYVNNEKLAPLVREIGWTHNLVIMEKCKNDLEGEFYLRMTGKFGWTKVVGWAMPTLLQKCKFVFGRPLRYSCPYPVVYTTENPNN